MCTPFPMLVNAKLPLRKKVILLGVFSLGIFITIIQIIRILTIKSLSDYLDSAELIMWSMVENNLGIIVGSIPALAPLFRSILDKTLHSSSRGRGGTNGTPYSLRNIYRKKNSDAKNQNNCSTPRSGSGKKNPEDELWRTEGGSNEHLNHPVSIYTRTDISVEHEPRIDREPPRPEYEPRVERGG